MKTLLGKFLEIGARTEEIPEEDEETASSSDSSLEEDSSSEDEDFHSSNVSNF